MAEDADVGVLDGAEDAVGHLLDGLVEAAVDAGDDDVHLGEGAVVEVELAFGEDVDFDAGRMRKTEGSGHRRNTGVSPLRCLRSR